MVQSDAIRVAILNKYGGIWLDADTIILNDKIIKQFQNYELGMIWEKKRKLHYISFIYAKNSSILKEWQRQIIIKVKKCKYFCLNKQNNIAWNNTFKIISFWNYLGNSIIDPLVNNINGKKFFHIDSNNTQVFPEFKYFQNSSIENMLKYKLFYFKKRNPLLVLNNTKGLIFLHNSWTPLQYKNLTVQAFLKEDILLSKLFLYLLKL